MNLVKNINYLGTVPRSRVSEIKQTYEFPERAKKLMDFIKFPNNKFSKSTNFIYGSFALKTQPYYSDIDTINDIYIDLQRNKSIGYIVREFKKIVKKIESKPGWFFTDAKAGMYPDGESVHWTSKEIAKGKRNGHIPDHNDHLGEKTLKDAIQENSLVKIDMVAPYYGRYIEVTVVYFFTDKQGNINFDSTQKNQKFILESLRKDTVKQFQAGKYFKTAKRIYAQAKANKDIEVLKALYPLISSNLSKLSAIESDIKTLILLIDEKHKLNKVLTNQELNVIIDKLSNIVDISFNEKAMIDAIRYTINNVRSNNYINALKSLHYIVNFIHSITNNQTTDYFIRNNLKYILEKYV